MARRALGRRCWPSDYVLSPIIPLSLKASLPKHRKYPEIISTVGDEFRAMRIDREMTQKEVARELGVNRNFICEMELGKLTQTIFSLHKAYLFLGYIPKTLDIKDSTLRGKLYAYRIRNGFTYTQVAKIIGVDKSTIARFENGREAKPKTLKLILSIFHT